MQNKTDNPLIVGVVGSERWGSSTEIVMDIIGDGVRQSGGRFELLRLADYNLPPLNIEKDTPQDAERVTKKIREADGIILGTPVYHGSYSSSLKCAIDYCGFDEFEDTTAGLVAVAGGSFPTSALTHMRTVCRSLNAWVLPKQLAVPDVSTNVDTNNRTITDSEYEERAIKMGIQLTEYSTESKDVSTTLGDENKGA